MIFSSQTDASSEIAFLGDAGVLARSPLPYQGLEPLPSGVSSSRGATTWFAANGGATRQTTRLMRFSADTCDVEGFQVDEPVIRAVGALDDGVLSSNTLNFTAEVRRRTPTGGLIAEQTIPGVDLVVLLPTPTRILAVGTDLDRTQGVLLELDAQTLAVARRTALTGTADPGPAAVVIGSEVLLASAVTSEQREGTTLEAIDVDTLARRSVPLPNAAPYLIAEAPDSVYVAHTYLNPGFRPLEEYRTITRYDPVQGGTRTFDVGGPLLDLRVDGDDLIVLTGDTESVTVARHDRQSGQRRSVVTVPAPTGSRSYAAGLVLAGAPGTAPS